MRTRTLLMTQKHQLRPTVVPLQGLLDKMLMKKASLWLMPPQSVSEELEAKIDSLSHECDGGVPFVPHHVTVVGEISYESPKKVQEKFEVLRADLQGTGGIPCCFKTDLERMRNADDTPVWNQACVSVMKRSGEFMALHKLARELFEIKDEEFPGPLGEPHLSHYYCKKDPPFAENVKVSPDFVAEEVELWETSGGYEGAKNWTKISTI